MTQTSAIPLNLPTVTEQDLFAFYNTHLAGDATSRFGAAFLPAQPVTPHDGTGADTSWKAKVRNGWAEIDGEDDDGLGYYADGVKRTLTDEQVAMFRHSEIHALLRQRQLRREREESAGLVAGGFLEGLESDGDSAQRESAMLNDDEAEADNKDDDVEDADDDAEYERFLQHEKTELANQRQSGTPGDPHDDLDYDGQSGGGGHGRRKEQQPELLQRRERVFYGDVDTGPENTSTRYPTPRYTRSREFQWPKIGG
ncbi:MAG: hypothetical protein M1838_005976 [Thelocarpon superellum]|nr:MAG: hypothetical protein M1838_005976 [Thelocarpon superellum]